ncbi:Membrane protein involved in the export of O-antigen and teichoic acid [Clostridium cavendishii DSM 21758]|uniref:Membrane protein involved in the export of O-antigen and teichoic acid n=1 Tax=Clostridium cavendishii DSM 21758 TaxID=1121302 RepID=A0A1M6QBQ2_9CLOT|nr:oligosaccharide flippase family protein [Clostridium cavendishii]SHK17672.1 Membrane protein involved in the export of O-antigen and teichoic acid [Clostridium cavendishii DSM 21758]
MSKFTKNLFKHIFNYGFATVLTSVLSFLLVPIYTRFLTPTDFGVIDIVNMFINIISVIIVLGLNSTLSIYYYNAKSIEEFKKSYSNVINFLMIISLFAIIIFVFINNQASFNIFRNTSKYIINLSFITGVFTALGQFPFYILQFRESSRMYGILSVFKFFCTAVLNIIFIVPMKLGALGMVLSYFIVSTIFLLIGAIISAKYYLLFLNLKDILSMLKISIGVIPHSIAGWALVFLDRIFLNKYVDMSEIGIYSFAYKIGTLMYILVCAINQAWSPIFMKTANEKGEEAKKIFNKSNKIYILIVGIINLLICLFAKEITIVMGSVAYINAYKIIPFITISYFFNGLYFMIINSLFYTKKTKYLPVATVTSVIVNAICNSILVPLIGIYGAAVTNVVTYITLFYIVYRLNNKFYGIKIPFNILFLTLLIQFIIIGFTSYFNVKNIFILIVIKLLLIILYLIIIKYSYLKEFNIRDLSIKKWREKAD